jgi:predicted ester cyclase
MTMQQTGLVHAADRQSVRLRVFVGGLVTAEENQYVWSPRKEVDMCTGDAEAGNKKLVRRVFAAIDAHVFDQLRELWAEDMICHMVGVPDPMDKNTTIEFIKSFYAVFPDFTHELHDVLAEGNRVVVRLTNHATHEIEFEGLAPTGKRIQYASVHMVTIEAGVIEEWWLLEDNLGFMTQLGMELVPAGVRDQ